MRVRLIVPLVVVLLAIAGGVALATGGEDLDCCAPPERGTGPSPEDVITYFGGGGLAGETTELAIRPDGLATVTSSIRGEDSVKRFRLQPDELEALRDRLSDVDLEELDQGRDDPCLDCYGFRISWGGVIAEADSATVDDDYIDVVEIFTELIERESVSETFVSLTRDGGFAPSQYEIAVAYDGSASVSYGTVPGEAETKTFEVTDDELERLKAAVEANPLDDLDDPDEPDVCNDCFIYTIAYQGSDYSFTDAAEVDERIVEVQSALLAIDAPIDPDGT